MNKKQLKHISHDQYRLLKRHIKKVATGFDAGEIHHFRVAFKKLRAFLRMVHSGDKKSRELKMPKKLRKAYHIAGSIRDLQLQQQRVQEAMAVEYKMPQDYLDRLQQTIDMLKPVFLDLVRANPVDESKKKTDAGIPEEFSFQQFCDFVKQQWSTLRTITAYRNMRDDHIHTIRKHLKDLFYNLDVFDGAKSAIWSMSTWKDKDDVYYFQLLDELGNFQDTCTAISMLDKKWIHGLNRYDQKFLATLKKCRVKEKRQMKQLLVKKLCPLKAGQHSSG